MAEREMEFRNLAAMFENAEETFSHLNAFTTVLPNGVRGVLKYSEAHELSLNFAVYLREYLNLQEGDRVAIQTPNCLAYPIAALGVLRAGCILVNTNPLYTPREMEYQYKDCGAKAVIIIDIFSEKLVEFLHVTDIKTVITVSIADLFPTPQKIFLKFMMKYVKKTLPKQTIKTVSFEKCIAQGKKLREQKHILPETYSSSLTPQTIACLQYTGGTTGISKAAILTHANLLANVSQVADAAKSQLVPGAETVLTALPLYHIFAFSVNFLTFYMLGSNNILIPSARPISNLKRAFSDYKVTWVSGINTLFSSLLKEKWFLDNPPATLKTAIAGGAALQAAVALKWKEKTKLSIMEGYGLTECSPVVTFMPFEGPDKIGTIGKPLKGTKLKIVDESGASVPTGTPGELLVQGPQVMAGYWNCPDETIKVLKDGWISTGDIAVVDEEGFYKIVDRKKDMILVSGFNVYPNEIEDCLAKLEGIVEVAVIGMPDENSGECVKAFIVKNKESLDEKQVKGFCRANLVAYKCPKHIEFLKELPKSPIGKVLRKMLR